MAAPVDARRGEARRSHPFARLLRENEIEPTGAQELFVNTKVCRARTATGSPARVGTV